MNKLAENAAYLTLTFTIAGQIITAQSVILAQVVWLIANIINVSRDYVLKRPTADKVRDWSLSGITGGMIIILMLF